MLLSNLFEDRTDLTGRSISGRGKCQQQVVTAVGRELLGFIWAIGVTVERQQRKTSPSIAA